MAALGPFAMDFRDSPARRLHPLPKLAFLLAFSIATTVAPAAFLAAALPVSALALSAAGVFRSGLRSGFAALAGHARFLLPLAAFILFFRVVDPWGPRVVDPGELPGAVGYVLRLALVFAVAEAYFRSTSAEELSAATSRAARRALRRDDIDPGFYLALAVGFIPRCFECWSRAREAALARGHGSLRARERRESPRPRRAGGPRSFARRPRGGRPRLASSLAIIETFMTTSIRGALGTSDAIEARCYSPSRTCAAHPLGRADLALLVLAAAMAALALVPA